MWGSLIGAGLQIGGGLLGFMGSPKAPSYRHKDADKFIKGFDNKINNIAGMTSGRAPTTSFDWTFENQGVGAAQTAVNLNASNLNLFNRMATQIYNTDVANKMNAINQIAPALMGQRDLASTMNNALMRGEVPIDVKRNIQRQAAQTATAGGFGTQSGVGKNISARDLGLTSVDLSTRGQEQAMQWGNLMTSSLPQQTSGSDILQLMSVNPNNAVQASLGAAGERLRSDMGNAERQEKRLFTSQGLLANAAGISLNANIDNLKNRYTSDLNKMNQKQNKMNALTGSISGAGGMLGGMFGQSAGQKAGSSLSSYGWGGA